MLRPDITTPAGIRQAFPMHPKMNHMHGGREEAKGQTLSFRIVGHRKHREIGSGEQRTPRASGG